MGNLLIFFYKVQTLRQYGIVLVFVFAHLHEDFDHVLHTVTNGPFIENRTEAFKDGSVCFGRIFRKKCANLTSKPNGNLDGVVGWAFEEQDKYLKCDDLVCNSLVDEVCNEGGG